MLIPRYAILYTKESYIDSCYFSSQLLPKGVNKKFLDSNNRTGPIFSANPGLFQSL